MYEYISFTDNKSVKLFFNPCCDFALQVSKVIAQNMKF